MTFQSLYSNLLKDLPALETYNYPWQALNDIEDMLVKAIPALSDEYDIRENIAIHKTARVDPTAKVLAPAIIGPDSFVGQHALLRGGVYVGTKASIGPGCEVKHSLIGGHTALAHFNFVGDSIIGSNVNFEAGAITANHYNERDDKNIFALWGGEKLETNKTKFGACIGDNSKIGANAVTSPGTILPPNSVVRRLELVEQV